MGGGVRGSGGQGGKFTLVYPSSNATLKVGVRRPFGYIGWARVGCSITRKIFFSLCKGAVTVGRRKEARYMLINGVGRGEERACSVRFIRNNAARHGTWEAHSTREAHSTGGGGEEGVAQGGRRKGTM